MKHPPAVILVLLSLFLSSQAVGLLVLNNYVDVKASEETGTRVYKELPSIFGVGIERPEVEDPTYSFVFIGIAVAIGTAILLLIMRFNRMGLWKLWYFMAVFLSLSIAWSAFIPQAIAWLASFIASAWKVVKPNFVIHNFTEVFIYSGLAAIFVPVMNTISASILLVLISVYDMIAVWKSKHMVSLAKFQASSNLFAGLSVPKSREVLKQSMKGNLKMKAEKSKSDDSAVAIIGGGDIGFPLIFAGTLLPAYGLAYTAIIPLCAAIGLAVLFAISKKGRFYPAMPFVSAGCFVGFGILWLVHYF